MAQIVVEAKASHTSDIAEKTEDSLLAKEFVLISNCSFAYYKFYYTFFPTKMFACEKMLNCIVVRK